jgi:hypothetical protein
MKRLFRSALLILFVALPLYAAGRSQNLMIPSTLQLGSNTLPAGEYRLTWTLSGDSAQVTLEKKDVPTVTVPAKVVQHRSKDVSISTKDLDSKQTIQSIALKDVTLVF